MHRLLVVGLAALAALVSSSSALAWSWPAEGDVLRPFTLGSDAYASGQHRGIDVGGSEGSAVVAPASGVVGFAGSLPTYGRGVTIVTADGFSVTLVHLGSITVAKGDTVEEGRPVGTIGWSGDAEHGVPSVHLGVRITAQSEGYVDPIGLLPPRRAPPVAPPAPTPVPAPAAAPAVAVPPTAATSAPQPPPAPPAPVVVAPPAPVPAAPEPESHGPEAVGAGASPAVPASDAPASGTAVAPFRIGGPPPTRTAQPEAAAPSRAPVPVAAIRSASRLPTRRNPEPAIPAAASPGRSTRVATGAAMPPSAPPPPLDARARDAGSRHVAESRADISASRNAHRPPDGVATPSDNGAPAKVARVRIAAEARQTRGGVDAVAFGAGVGDDRGGPPGVVAATLALLLLALGASAKAARRIGADGAVLRHHADLLRQLHAAHRSRVHDRRGGRDRSSSAAARP